MNDKDKLDEMLLQSKNDANKFFSKVPYENMNQAVFLRVEKNRNSVSSKKYNKYRLVTGISVLSACFIIFMTAVFVFKGRDDFEAENLEAMGKPVSQQMIQFDNENLSQWLHFFKINKPDQVDNNLLAVIWKSGDRGDYELAYSSLFENSSRPQPVTMIAFPDNQPSMFIISSQNDDKEYIHYRILGYKEDKILAYMEQNYVAGGEIEVVDGVLKETRLVPNNYVEKENDRDMRQIITYYIPYQVNEFGDITPSVDRLKIHTGEHIAIIGDESAPIEELNSELLLDWEMGNKLTGANKNIKFLYAENPGYEDLYIKPIKGGGSKKISVEVLGDEETMKEY